MDGAKSIIESFTSLERDSKLDEGLGAIAASKLADLARGFILKARPIIVLHNSSKNSTVTLKLRRGLINHTLVSSEEGKPDKRIAKGMSAALLLTKALNEVRKLVGQGYIEI